jgi:TonB family protein
MTESVTDIIVARSRRPEELRPMVLWSAGAHVLLLALAILWPARATHIEEPHMIISLGGSPGPRSGGMTPLGARAVQAPEPRPKPAEPAPPPPKVAAPDPQVRPRAQTPQPKQAPPDSKARKPNTGAEPVVGSARAETEVVRGQGFGLSTSGGTGGPVSLDVPDFCCWDYINQMRETITRAWDNNQSVKGSALVKFTIMRDGTIRSPEIEKSSSYLALDNAALRAVQLTRLPPLPLLFPNETLTVHLRFDYQR